MSAALSNSKLVIAWLLIGLAGLAAGGWSYLSRRSALVQDLLVDARRCALAFSATELAALAGTPADVDSPVYLTVKARLAALRSVTERVRFIYLFRQVPGMREVVFLADSEPADSREISLPGDVYAEAGDSPGLQEVLATGRPTTEGPLSDSFGTWVTGYALVRVAAVPESPWPVKEVLGLDIDASDWHRDLLGAGLRSAAMVWLLLGLPLGVMMVLRKQLGLTATVRKFSAALEQSQAAVMIVDLESRIEYANLGLCLQMGYPRAELLGRRWQEFQVAETSPSTLGELVANVRAHRAWQGEWVNKRKDGGRYPVRGIVSPVRDEKGALMCFIAVFDDMTTVKKNETELRLAKEQAEAGSVAKSRFLATMSHELRTPLNGIVGFTSLILDTPLTPEQRDYVQTIRTSGQALVDLTSELLDYSSIEAGRIQLEKACFSPLAVVEESLDIFAARAAEKHIELLHRVDAAVPAFVLGDAGRLRQVIVNLVGNAVKFTLAGEIQITLAMRAGDPSQQRLEVQVRDTGIGIPAEAQARLFQPFSQVDGGKMRRHGGVGLGLAISRTLVRLMGGEIELESTPGVGSRFTFTILAENARPEPGLEPLTPVKITGRNVAIVSAHAGLREELAALVSARGGAPVFCAWGEAAATQAELVLVDADAALLAQLLDGRAPAPPRRAEHLLVLVPVTCTALERQALRQRVRAIANKPLHQHALDEFLSVAAGGEAAAPLVRPKPQLALRVLLVDDNRINQRLLQKMMEALGCSWVSVVDGREAIEQLSVDSFDVVLMDVHMPEIDGIEASRRIRCGEAGPVAREVWIAAVTADTSEEQRRVAFEAGVNDYLEKPVTVGDIEAALRRFLHERAAARGRKE